MTETVTKNKCNLCPMIFDSPQKLGSHKRIIHPGNALRKKKPEKPGKVKAGQKFAPIECPECNLPFKGIMGLAHHRQAAHGVESQNAKEIRLRKERMSAGAQIAVTSHEEKPVTHVPKNHEADVSRQEDHSAAIAYALAVGQLQERCRSIAEEHDLPARLFTRQVAQLFLAQTRR